ncbi:MAG TPA: succinate dehydrogenase/fumarate reductase iron-sulfur subunit [Thermoplasmata archaeon]|nr:succinate dehydrogenase/fumarate reductase iron-sulfur subunit [Thermoplasmata archaeon]
MSAPPPTVKVPFSIYRYEPGRDRSPRYQEYTLDLAPHTPLLTALLRIRAEIDPTLSIRYSCRSAICGSCAMQVNSKSRLACETPVGPELEKHGRIVVEPMRNQPVVRDLVVDQSPFWTQYTKVEPHLKLDPRRPMPEGAPNPMTPAEVERFYETPRCIACAACFSACPAVEVDPEFPGPMALAKLYRYTVDPRDQAHQERLLRIQPGGLWLCLRCHLCTESCPKDVRPSERIRDLKEMAIAVQGATEQGSRHAFYFKENLKDGGLLNEMKLARQTYGLFGLVKELPQGVRIMRKKPEMRKKPHPIEGADEVRKIYDALDAKEAPK